MSTVRTASIAMSFWTCEVEMSHSCHVVAALDRRTPREMNMPDYPHDTYSYFFFNFPHLNVLSDSILKEEFLIPSRHVEKVNEAFDKPHNHVYFFISAVNSKLIHVGDDRHLPI